MIFDLCTPLPPQAPSCALAVVNPRHQGSLHADAIHSCISRTTACSSSPSGLQNSRISSSKFSRARGQKYFPKGHLRLQGPQFSRASRVSGLSKIKDAQGLSQKFLRQKGLSFQDFRTQGPKTSTRASGFFKNFNFQGLLKGPQRLKIFSQTFRVKGLEGFVLQVSEGTWSEISTMGIWVFEGFNFLGLRGLKGSS